MKNKGFTTLELLIAVGVVGVITTLASGAYYYYIPKGQAIEAVALAKNAQMVALGNIKQATCAVGDDSKDIFIGKYGQAQIGGAFKVSSGSSCPSGCTIEYKFNASGVAGDLKGKVLALDVLNDGRVSKNLTKTTLDEKYLPRDLVNITSTDSCVASAPTVAVKTEGLISGTEVGDADSTPPPPPTPSTPTPTDPNTPSGDAGNTEGSGSPTPNPTGKYNIFIGEVFMGVSAEMGLMTYFYPLDLNNPQDLAYFNGDKSLSLHIAIANRTSKQWGGGNGFGVHAYPGGGYYSHGSGRVSELGRIHAIDKFYRQYVMTYGRCPTTNETPPQFRSFGVCHMNTALFNRY